MILCPCQAANSFAKKNLSRAMPQPQIKASAQLNYPADGAAGISRTDSLGCHSESRFGGMKNLSRMRDRRPFGRDSSPPPQNAGSAQNDPAHGGAGKLLYIINFEILNQF